MSQWRAFSSREHPMLPSLCRLFLDSLRVFLRTQQGGLLERAEIPTCNSSVFAGLVGHAFRDISVIIMHNTPSRPTHPLEARRGRDAALRRYIIILPFYLNADDGKLSFEEFKNYFADGILSSEELWELFSGIDRRHSE